MYLTELDRLFTSNKIDITVITSSRIKDEFKNTIRINRFQEFDKGLLKQEVHNIVVREFGAFSYLLEDNLKL
jgi:hypothetical protein